MDSEISLPNPASSFAAELPSPPVLSKDRQAATLREVIRVLRLEADAILACAARLEGTAPRQSGPPGVAEAIELFQGALLRGKKLILMGVGKSGKIAQKIAATLCSTGSVAVYLHPTEGLHGDLGLVTPGDVVWALSYTGNSEELVRILPILKAKGIPIVGMGGFRHSQLGNACDVWMDAFVEKEACPQGLAPTSSTTLALALGDAVAMALMQLQGFDRQAFAANHPGGALGNRLRLKVKDLMHPLVSLPCLGPQSSMAEVIGLATERKLGAVLITQGSHLLGMITDGDIRRALRLQEEFFRLTAAQVMTEQPVTISSDAMAQEALHLMENRSSQIHVLPVLDSDGNLDGLLRLHDLVRSL
jgi:arabinose-5-phosphate isomerase